MDEVVLTEQDGGVLRVTLNRPDRLNSFTVEMHRQLAAALERARGPEVRAVLLTGAGRGFCAGQDLSDVAPGGNVGQVLEEWFNPLVRTLRELPKPVLCAVQGVAAGAGANVAFACDIVLAGASARFIQAFVKIGLVPDAGGTWLLPRLAGDARARAMAMLGEPVTAAQAEQWGLVWRTVPDEELAAEASRVAGQLAALPTQAMGLMKRAFLASGRNTLEEQLGLERALQAEAGRTPDFAEGVRAFREKRPASFSGRPA